MNVLQVTGLAILLLSGAGRKGYSQSDSAFKSISLIHLDAFRDPPKNWVTASDAVADLLKPMDLRPINGEGAIVDVFTKTDPMHLLTKAEFADVQVELDFMSAKNSGSGIYMMGRYELQLPDSWTKLNPSAADAGGIFTNQDAQRGAFEGTPPLMNVARAPGLWQHLSLKFRAPKFNAQGQKIINARFDEVYLNGVLVQQLTSVSGPTSRSIFKDEKATGPLALRGDRGPVAFKNLRYRELAQTQDSSGEAKEYGETSNPIIINPGTRPYLLRSFVEYGDRKLTHVLSAGDPSQINYSYDLKQGAVFQVWRGEFLDVTQMWHERGEPQLAVPLGSVIKLSDAPAVARLSTPNDPWPDSVAFDDLVSRGYMLDKKRTPTFTYIIKGIEVTDSLSSQTNGEGINRTITVANPAANTYVRLGESGVIENISEGLYAMNGKSYYIRVDKKYKPVVRQSSKGKELLVKYDSANPLTYSIIW